MTESSLLKALGVALVGAVLLAGSGIVFRGNQSVNPHDKCDQAITTSSEAKDAIKSNKDAAEVFKRELQETVTKFEQRLKELEDKVFATAVSTTKSLLDARTQEPSKPLENATIAASQSIDGVRERLSAINTGVADVEKGIRDANSSISVLAFQIERLKPDANLADQIDKIRANQEAVASAARDAQAQKAAAQDAWQSLKALHESLDVCQRDSGALTQQARDQKVELDKLTESLADMREALDEAKRKLATVASLQLQVKLVADSADAARSAAQRATDAANAAGAALAAIENDRKRADSAGDLVGRAEALASHVENLEQRVKKLEELPQSPFASPQPKPRRH